VSETVVRESVDGVETVEIAGMEVALTPFCTYKFQEACRLVAEMVEEFGVGELLENIGGLGGEDVTATQAGLTLAPLLPKVLRQLPDAVRRFVAVCCIPDVRLRELYDEANGIKKEREEIEALLLFSARPSELAHAFGKFLGCLEINDLKNEIGQVVETFQGLMSQPQPKKRARRRG
jgi:hypothetical protein